MSEITATCSGCDREFPLEVPDGDSAGARWLRALAKRFRCEDCEEAERRDRDERERLAARQARRAACKIPKRYRGVDLADLEPREGQRSAIAAAQEWAQRGDAGGLMLTGDVGVGKTRIATAACWSRLERWPCLYVKIAQAMQRLGAGFADEGRQEAVRIFGGENPIVIDDLGKTRVTDYGREAIHSAIDSRYQAEVPILITTNLLPEQIGEHYGEQVKSRLIEYCRIVKVAGGDQRLVEARQRAGLKAA